MGVGERTGTRSLEDRLPALPGYSRLESAGGMGELLVKVVKATFTPPFTWGGELLAECGQTIRRCFIPLVISISFFAFGIVVTLIAGLLGALGTIDRTGAGMITGWPREVAYWVTGMIFAGVVGSAITADLGARKIREELDAMAVLGVDSVRVLIVPRVLALVLMAPVLGAIALFNAVFLIYVTAPLALPNATTYSYVETLRTLINVPDLVSFLLRCGVTGLFVGIVSCAKGLGVSGGSEGVGRAVNQAVLISFMGIWILNSLWNAAFLPTFPDVSTLTG
jgi:phospholipid/cholesterol/gamma-HCH transport system permease protein